MLRSPPQAGVSKDEPESRGSWRGAMLYLIEQCLNGIQLGMLLFLLAAGLTLIFGIMDLVNLAHGSLYMLGAYFAATLAALTGSFIAGAFLALVATLLVGMAVEVIAMRRLYGRDHLDHVLGTFGLILFFNELVRLIWGPEGRTLSLPSQMLTAVQVLPGIYYPVVSPGYHRGHLDRCAAALHLGHAHAHRHADPRRRFQPRDGRRARRQYQAALHAGIRPRRGARRLRRHDRRRRSPIVQIGMGENILILAFVVIIIGGIGSIRGAFVASIIVGLIDTIGRAFLPDLFREFLSYSAGSSLGTSISSMLIYVLMAAILVFRPEGLFPANK